MEKKIENIPSLYSLTKPEPNPKPRRNFRDLKSIWDKNKVLPQVDKKLRPKFTSTFRLNLGQKL